MGRILVTGAAGFIGSHLVERLVARGDDVTGIDNFDPFYDREVKLRNLAGLAGHARFRLIEADVTDVQALAAALTDFRVEAVVHLAALAGVRPSLAEPERFHHANVTGTVRLLAACRAHGVRRVVLASSSSVYGLGTPVPFREDAPCDRPASPYAATKRAMEIEAFPRHHLDGFSITCLRYFTVYGPRQRPDLAIHKFARLISEGRPIPFFGDGTTSRDYTWVDDIVDGTVAALDEVVRTTAPAFRIYNLGGEKAVSLARLVDLIADALGRTPVLEHQPPQPGDLPHTRADVTRARAALGFVPKVAIEVGIPRFCAWFRSVRGV